MFYNGQNDGIDIPLGKITYPLALFLIRDESSPSPETSNIIKYIGNADDMSAFDTKTGKITRSPESKNLFLNDHVFSMCDYSSSGYPYGFTDCYGYLSSGKFFEFNRKDNNTMRITRNYDYGGGTLVSGDSYNYIVVGK